MLDGVARLFNQGTVIQEFGMQLGCIVNDQPRLMGAAANVYDPLTLWIDLKSLGEMGHYSALRKLEPSAHFVEFPALATTSKKQKEKTPKTPIAPTKPDSTGTEEDKTLKASEKSVSNAAEEDFDVWRCLRDNIDIRLVYKGTLEKAIHLV